MHVAKRWWTRVHPRWRRRAMPVTTTPSAAPYRVFAAPCSPPIVKKHGRIERISSANDRVRPEHMRQRGRLCPRNDANEPEAGRGVGGLRRPTADGVKVREDETPPRGRQERPRHWLNGVETQRGCVPITSAELP